MGRDLVKASEARAQIAQIDKYNSAVNAFYIKYKGLPGDLALGLATQFGFTVGAGCVGIQGQRDGNGLIDGWFNPNPMLQGVGEVALFWEDLSSVGYIDGSFPNGGGTAINCNALGAPALNASTASEYFPAGKIGYGNYIYVYETEGLNWFGLSAVTATFIDGELDSSGTIPVIQAYNIDKKMDDGLPITGAVQAVFLNGYSTLVDSNNGNPDTPTTCLNSSTLQYSIGQNNGSGTNCGLSFKMTGAGR